MGEARQSISDARLDGLNFRYQIMTPDLSHALDDVYAVFARYEAPNHLGIGGNFQLRDLTVKRWHELNEQHDISVLMYSDDGSMFRYFLPRWLEWLSEEEAARDDLRDWEIWWLGYRLAQAKWKSWQTEEVAALRALFETWVREEFAEQDGAPPSDYPRTSDNLGEDGERLGLVGFSVDTGLLEFLCEIGEAPLYLELWLDLNLPQLARWLWIKDLPHCKGAREWVMSSRLENELENAFFAETNGPNAELFSRSIELVRSLRAQ